MKKLWDRIRKWIIRKLGGYVTPWDPTSRVMEELKTEHPIESIGVGVRVTAWDGFTSLEYLAHQIRKATNELGKELLAGGFVTVQFYDCQEYRDYRLSVQAVKVTKVNDKFLQKILEKEDV